MYKEASLHARARTQVKPENVMVTQELIIKLGDFGQEHTHAHMIAGPCTHMHTSSVRAHLCVPAYLRLFTGTHELEVYDR